ncbi:MAG: hypothetical protein HRT58_22350 [Crocinitomicaceae bacterium]|nr:hypothetical protein [Flavobacteriales bacterium]NQZ38419.1 hypothetical protein [Crocinitomicaceae bacterium]
MISKKDLFIQTKSINCDFTSVLPLEDTEVASTNSSSNTPKGIVKLSFDCRKVTDVKNLSKTDKFLVTVTQRIQCANLSGFVTTPNGSNSFLDYPASIYNTLSLSTSSQSNFDIQVLDYFPKTLNAAVNTNSSQSQGSTNGQSNAHTSGSSASNTNSYGGSLSGSLGFFGDAPMGSLSASGNYEHSTTNEYSDSNTTSNSLDKSNNLSDSLSMSIKDWGSFAAMNLDQNKFTWLWGQQYPWNALNCYSSGGDITVPDYVAARLVDPNVGDGIALPPSELSLYGVDFTCMISFLITPKTDSSEISFDHIIGMVTATHEYNQRRPNDLSLTIKDRTPTTTKGIQFDLNKLSLAPIQTLGYGNGAGIGFLKDRFQTIPITSASTFGILSESNNMNINGSGFIYSNNSLNATFASISTTPGASMTIDFKVIDHSLDLILFMKHWVTSDIGVYMQITINGQVLSNVHIDLQEGQGGDHNISKVVLKNKNIASIDYCDYLIMGLNTITVDFFRSDTPNTGSADYVLKALTLG